MLERNENISEIYNEYKKKIKCSIYYDFLNNYNLGDDVVNEVFAILLKRTQKIKNIDQLVSQIKFKIKYWIIEATSKVIKKQKGDIKLLNPENIKGFYEKVQFLIKKYGYHEKQAKEIVIIKESISRFRFVKATNPGSIEKTNRGETSSKDREDIRPWYDIIRNPNKEHIEIQDDFLIEADRITVFAEAQAFCFEKWRNRRGKNVVRDHLILTDFHFREIKKKDLAKKYNRSKGRITQITKKGLAFIAKCIENRLTKIRNEVLI